MSVVQVNTTALSDLAERLRAVSPAAADRLAANLRDAGELLATAARARAPGKVPSSIKVEATGVSVRVITRLPEAVAIENKGKGFVRHPVFGNRTVWTAKNSHAAFLAPALTATRELIVAKVVSSIHEAFVQVGVAG